MQHLKTTNPENVETGNLLGWKFRSAARAIVFDNEGRVGLLNVKKHNYYKLPGGGIEEGENMQSALDRECEEELGVKIKVTKEVGSIIEYRAKFQLCQTSYCFCAIINSDKKVPNFTDKEKAEGFEIVWVSPNEALRLINLKETSDYQGIFIGERDSCFLKKGLELK